MKKTFTRDEVVEIRSNSATKNWTRAVYLGEATLLYGHRPWHTVAVSAALRYTVPINRIRKVPK